jgi:predicted AlkP superfamily pyrophosphatase or phosphodiesterase
MKHKTVEIFLFIDALGWKIVNDHGFLSDLLPFRKKITMQFGYSSSAIPTILSGKTPAVHGHLGLFRFAPESSPFKVLSRLSFLFKPDFFWNRGRVRHHLSKMIKKLYGFTGYFQLYRMPLWKLRFVDYCEKKDLFVKGGMEDIPNLHDTLSEMQIPFHISDWHLKDDDNFTEAEKALSQGKKFLFVYTAGFDGVLHTHVSHPEKVKAALDQLTRQIEQLYAVARQKADEVNFTVISDHGMTPLTGTADVMAALEKSNLVFGKDYGACYDSTMARFYI